MSMNGIDISNWQAGINLEKVPCDFVIIKATEGTGYVSPDWNRQYQQAKKEGKGLGLYHYANGGNVKSEADFFLKKIKGCVGEAVLALDWESSNNPEFEKGGASWVKQWLDYIYKKTKVRPLLYIQQSAMYRFQKIGNYGLWVAQYADNNASGYQEHPWKEGEYTCAVRQYTSHGRLKGYDGNLDLNKFYGNRTAWNKYARKNGSNKPAPGKKKTLNVLAKEVIAGRWGNGEDRKKRLKAAGYNYNSVQKRVNEIMAARAVKYHVIKEGETLSGIASRYGTTIAKLQSWNGISNPDLIYAGSRIRVR